MGMDARMCRFINSFVMLLALLAEVVHMHDYNNLGQSQKHRDIEC